MLYMVIEKYKTDAAVEIYRRARDLGRMFPDGLEYISSWVNLDFNTCFQLMEAKDQSLFEPWIERWKDLVEFEVIPVRTSAEAFQIIAPKL